MNKVKLVFRVYKISSFAAGVFVGVYVLLISFPQVLLANSTVQGHFTVYSREPQNNGIVNVLDSAEQRLRRSPLYDESVERRVYLTGSFGMYSLLSNKAYRSFANSVPLINNILINKSDVEQDRVYVNRPEHNSRTLSGVIAHEVTHLFIRQHYGTVKSSLMPTWKNEGYCEYIAGDTTMPFEEGMRLWRENTSGDTGYRYIKYQAMVKYLLENEGLSVDALFTQDLDEKAIAAKAFAALADRN